MENGTPAESLDVQTGRIQDIQTVDGFRADACTQGEGYMELYQELEKLTGQLEASIKMLRKNGSAYAEAERDYKVLLRTECLKLKDEGMAIGLITLTCYGIPSVAEARLKRDIADATYTANKEAIASIKLRLRLIENQIQREWSATGVGNL